MGFVQYHRILVKAQKFKSSSCLFFAVKREPKRSEISELAHLKNLLIPPICCFSDFWKALCGVIKT